MESFVVDVERRAEILQTMENLPPLTRLHASLKGPISGSGLAERLEMYSFNGYILEGLNGKAMSALKLLQNKEAEGKLPPGSTPIVPSSGNTLINVAYFRNAFGLKRVIGVADRSIPVGKVAQIRLAGASLEYVEGNQGTIERARELEQMGAGVLLNQYSEWGSVEGHEWTMNHVAREMRRLGKIPSFLCAGAGTCSTLVAAHYYLRKDFPNLQVVGVGCDQGERIPGCRTLEAIRRDIKFPWQEAIAPYDLILVNRLSAYRMSKRIIETGKPVGPSGGLAVEGFFKLFGNLDSSGELERFVNPDGRLIVVFIFMDAFPAYGEDYLKVLGGSDL